MRFTNSRERILRADSHFENSTKLWDRFLEDEPYDAFPEVEPDGTGAIYVTPQYETLPVVFAIELGEMLYQLRAALDSLIYHAAILDTGQDPPPNEKNLEFPFCGTAENFRSVAMKIQPLAKQRRAIVESVQPYNAPNVTAAERGIIESLSMVHDWARIDRHRRLHVIGSWASESRPQLRLPDGVTIASLTVTSGVGHFLEDQSKVASFVLNGWKAGMNIQANPNLFIDITVQEAGPTGGHSKLTDVSNRFMIAVQNVLRRFEDSY